MLYFNKGEKSTFSRLLQIKCIVDSSVPSILLPWVRVPSTPSTLFSTYIAQIVCLSFELECEKNENKQKEAGNGPFKKNPKCIVDESAPEESSVIKSSESAKASVLHF